VTGRAAHRGPARRRSRWHRPFRPAGLAILACGVLASGAAVTGLAWASHSGHPALPAGSVRRLADPAGLAAASPGAARAVARPVSLIIPVIGVRTRLIRLGVTRAGTLQVPKSTAVAGWYTGSPRPGAIGSAVIAGHIDSYRGPGVFFRLRLLHPADRIYVRRADGTLALFRVTAVRTYLKDHFPTQAVYGPAPGAQLRVITCGGTFDRALGSYLSNVIVFATEVPGHTDLRHGHHRHGHHRHGHRRSANHPHHPHRPPGEHRPPVPTAGAF
jgi:sortase (surface protein transpeptidase)